MHMCMYFLRRHLLFSLSITVRPNPGGPNLIGDGLPHAEPPRTGGGLLGTWAFDERSGNMSSPTLHVHRHANVDTHACSNNYLCTFPHIPCVQYISVFLFSGAE